VCRRLFNRVLLWPIQQSLKDSHTHRTELKGSRHKVESPAQINGRAGGLKGGKARAAKLSVSERREQARKAARARWAKRDSK
jgi:hypothetical protein